MKIVKTFLAAVAFFAMAFSAQAVTLQSIGSANTEVYNARAVLKVTSVDPTGTPMPTPAAGGSNVVLNGISGSAATSYFDKLTTSAAAGATAAKQDTAFGAQTTTAQDITDIENVLKSVTGSAKFNVWLQNPLTGVPYDSSTGVPVAVVSTTSSANAMETRYEASATWLTQSTTTYNMTSTAGVDGRYNITLRAARGGTSVVYAINASATPQATVATLDGREVITGASHKTEGPCYESGTHIHARASGTAQVVGSLILERCK